MKPITAGYKLVHLASGKYSIHSLAYGETLHPFTGPVAEAEALYVNSLVVPNGSTLDLNGLHVYTRGTQLGGNVVGGSVSQARLSVRHGRR